METPTEMSSAISARSSSANEEPIVSNLVALTSLSTHPFEPDPTAGLTVRASFVNTSSTPIHTPVFVVTELSNGNVLFNSDPGYGEVGSVLSPFVGGDRVLSPGESFDVEFDILFAERKPFTFFVDLLVVAVPERLRWHTAEPQNSGSLTLSRSRPRFECVCILSHAECLGRISSVKSFGPTLEPPESSGLGANWRSPMHPPTGWFPTKNISFCSLILTGASP
jgi:hypothetical protein